VNIWFSLPGIGELRIVSIFMNNTLEIIPFQTKVEIRKNEDGYHTMQGKNGGGYRDRTGDLLHAMQALSQSELIPQTVL
jgi:hypothetical protein